MSDGPALSPDSPQLPYFEQTFKPTVADLQANSQGLQTLTAPEVPAAARIALIAVVVVPVVIANASGAGVGGGMAWIFIISGLGFGAFALWSSKRILRDYADEMRIVNMTAHPERGWNANGAGDARGVAFKPGRR